MIDHHANRCMAEKPAVPAAEHLHQLSSPDPYDPDPEFIANTIEHLSKRAAIGAPSDVLVYPLEEGKHLLGRCRPILSSIHRYHSRVFFSNPCFVF